MNKEELRRKFSALRGRLSNEQVSSLSISLFSYLRDMSIWEKNYYHIFLPIKNKKEVSTYPIIKYLWEKNKKIAISKLDPSTISMNSTYFFKKETLLEEGRYKIPQPVDALQVNPSLIEIIFVPLLAFDASGHRVGYGKGFYDSFLADKKNALKIGLSFFDPVDKITNLSLQDIPLDWAVTPLGKYKF